MAVVSVSIGSNIEREQHIAAALDALAEKYGELQVSPVFESESVGFEGSAFFNLVAAFETTSPLVELGQALKEIEVDNGRQKGAPKFSSRTLDIDILTYDDCVGCIEGIELPRAEILTNAFVLWPLAVLWPNACHPVCQRPYSQLWADYQGRQSLWVVPFTWRGRDLSEAYRHIVDQAGGA